MVRIIVAGAGGHMGRMILAVASNVQDCRVTGAFERAGNPAVGQDSGLLAGTGENGIPVTDNPAALLADADVVIDFTAPEAAVRHGALCSGAGVALVIGTTGLDAGQRREIERVAVSVPVVLSPNMSVGVNLSYRLLREAARVLGPDYDIEIIEAHHNRKKDAPSGTAARMLDVLAEARELDPGQAGIYGRRGLVGARPATEIGVHAVRAGDIVGDHTVLFAGPGERIEITHRAHSRETFARGALRAALWVSGRRPGLYDMADVLGLE